MMVYGLRDVEELPPEILGEILPEIAVCGMRDAEELPPELLPLGTVSMPPKVPTVLNLTSPTRLNELLDPTESLDVDSLDENLSHSAERRALQKPSASRSASSHERLCQEDPAPPKPAAPGVSSVALEAAQLAMQKAIAWDQLVSPLEQRAAAAGLQRRGGTHAAPTPQSPLCRRWERFATLRPVVRRLGGGAEALPPQRSPQGAATTPTATCPPNRTSRSPVLRSPKDSRSPVKMAQGWLCKQLRLAALDGQVSSEMTDGDAEDSWLMSPAMKDDGRGTPVPAKHARLALGDVTQARENVR
jgi:hypothetical protein